MVALLEFITLLLLMPFLIVYIAWVQFYNFINSVAHFELLLAGICAAWVGGILVGQMGPDDSPFQTLVQVMATSTVFGMPVPYIQVGFGASLIVAAVVIRIFRPATPITIAGG